MISIRIFSGRKDDFLAGCVRFVREVHYSMEAIDGVLERACRGESEALSLLYHRFLPGIFAYIAARVPDRSVAEDLTSDVFLAMVEHIHQFKKRDEAGFVAWLLQIARITVAGFYRKQSKQPIQLSLEHVLSTEPQGRAVAALRARGSSDDPVHYAEIREEWADTVQAINALTEEQRQVLIGRLFMGYDLTTLAGIVGKKVNAVKALQFRALHRLQHLLKNRG